MARTIVAESRIARGSVTRNTLRAAGTLPTTRVPLRGGGGGSNTKPSNPRPPVRETGISLCATIPSESYFTYQFTLGPSALSSEDANSTCAFAAALTRTPNASVPLSAVEYGASAESSRSASVILVLVLSTMMLSPLAGSLCPGWASSVSTFTARTGDTDLPNITGVGAVFFDPRDAGTEFELYEDVRERIMPGAFDRCLRQRQDVRGLFNHDPNCLLGRTAAGTMNLSVDKRGLVVEITDAGRQKLRVPRRGVGCFRRSLLTRFLLHDGMMDHALDQRSKRGQILFLDSQ